MRKTVAAAMLFVLPPGAGEAQPRPFNCVGAELLEDDVFAVPFAPRAVAPAEAARGNLDAAAALAKREPERNICVLGHAAPQEGGAASGAQLAAQRAGAVAEALARLGVDRDRLRAEARRAAFARGAVPAERSVTVVVLPVVEAAPADAPPQGAAPQAAPPLVAPPAGTPAGAAPPARPESPGAR